MERDFSHLPSPMGEAYDRANPSNCHQNDRYGKHTAIAIDSQHNSEDAERNAQESTKEPTPPEAIIKAWNYIKDEHNARGIQTVLAILIFLVTSYIAWIYSGQLCQMIEQNRNSREFFQTEARAQITFRNIRWRVDRTAQPPKAIQQKCADEGTDIHICFEIDLVNGGHGPAPETKIIAHILRPEVKDAKATIERIPSPNWDESEGSQPMSSGSHEWGESSIETVESNCKSGDCISQTEADKMIGGDLPLYIYGMAQYRDMFHGKHVTRFCYFQPAIKCTSPPGGCMMPCRFGNYFDRPEDVR